MLLELVLVAAVLTLVGVALFQSNHKSAPAASDAASLPKLTTSQAAESAAKAIEASANTELEVSAAADTEADELSAVDADVTNLGSSSNATNF